MIFGETLNSINNQLKYMVNYFDNPATTDVHQWMFPHAAALSQLWLWPEVNGNGFDLTGVLKINGVPVAARTWDRPDRFADIRGSVWDLNITVLKRTLLQLTVIHNTSPGGALAYGITGTWLRE